MAFDRSWTWPSRKYTGRGFRDGELILDTISGRDSDQVSLVSKAGNDGASSRLQRLFESLGFDIVQLLTQDIKGYASSEEKKILLLKDFRSACYLSLLHVIPFAASTTLIGLNLKGLYIGAELQGPVGQDDLRLLGLQFAAKILELLAVASLTTIMVTMIRNQLISNSLPFGAITAGYEFSKLSFLWSKGFVATCATRFPAARHKTLLITSIIIFTILSTTIGPSAATAAQPEFREWSAGGTSVWLNVTPKELWPSQLDEMAPSELQCASSQNASCYPADYDAMTNALFSFWSLSTRSSPDGNRLSQVIPEKVSLAGRRSVHTMEMRFKGPFTYQPELTVATTPLTALSDVLPVIGNYWFIANGIRCRSSKAGFCNYKDFFYSMKAMQPVTYVRCAASNISDTPRFPQLTPPFPLADYNDDTLGSQRWFDEVTNDSSRSGLDWIDLPDAKYGKTSIGAVAAIPGIDSSDHPNQAFFCTIDARWAPSNVTASFLGGPDIVSGSPDGWYLGGQHQEDSNNQPLWPHIDITPAWAGAINSRISETSQSVFSTLCNSVSRLDNIAKAALPVNAVEAILAVMVTEALAHSGSQASILGSLKGFENSEWADEFLPQGGVFGPGGSAFDYSPQQADQFTRLEMQTMILGYGYGTSTATILSMIVLFVYSLIALIYILYSTCYAKTTSNAWESITELVALAVNSDSSATLRNTGAGIGSLGVLKQPVKVGVSDDCLQLVFKDEGSTSRVNQNEHYG